MVSWCGQRDEKARRPLGPDVRASSLPLIRGVSAHTRQLYGVPSHSGFHFGQAHDISPLRGENFRGASEYRPARFPVAQSRPCLLEGSHTIRYLLPGWAGHTARSEADWRKLPPLSDRAGSALDLHATMRLLIRIREQNRAA